MVLENSIIESEGRSQYDECAIRVLSNRQVLSMILKHTVHEYNRLSIAEIAECIDEPSVGEIPLDSNIQGIAQVSKIPGSSTVTYDIRFLARIPESREKTEYRIMVDVEAQKKPDPGYDLVTRGIDYAGRMLSDQFGVYITNSHYDNTLKVYSIWVVMNCPGDYGNSIVEYSISRNNLHGINERDTRYDLLRVIMVYLLKPDATGVNKPSVLHDFLGILFSNRPGNEIVKSLRENYGILVEEKLEGELNVMCNLSEGIFERGELTGTIRAYLAGALNREYILETFNLSEDEFEAAIKSIAN